MRNMIIIMAAVVVCLTSSAHAHTSEEEYERAFFEEREKMQEQCTTEKINLLEDYAEWVLPKLQQREKKAWSYSANGSNVALQSSCPSAAPCDNIIRRFDTCASMARSCISAIPKVDGDQSCSVLLCYERKVQCMGEVMTDYAQCVRSKSR